MVDRVYSSQPTWHLGNLTRYIQAYQMSQNHKSMELVF